MNTMEERKIVVPGETIIQGDDFLPGDGTRREGKDIVANRFGLADISDRLIRVIALSGVYTPRRGNVVIGQITAITMKGWIVDFGAHNSGFLNVSEVPRYIARGELRDFLDYGDVICGSVFSTDGNNVDLSIKMRGFGKLIGGQLIDVNPNKVPRIIGKEGSMVSLIKGATNCSITVGQNGVIWLRGEKIEDELNAKKIIEFICENSFISGLTEKVEDYIKKDLKLEIKKVSLAPIEEEIIEEEIESEKQNEEEEQ